MYTQATGNYQLTQKTATKTALYPAQAWASFNFDACHLAWQEPLAHFNVWWIRFSWTSVCHYIIMLMTSWLILQIRINVYFTSGKSLVALVKPIWHCEVRNAKLPCPKCHILVMGSQVKECHLISRNCLQLKSGPHTPQMSENFWVWLHTTDAIFYISPTRQAGTSPTTGPWASALFNNSSLQYFLNLMFNFFLKCAGTLLGGTWTRLPVIGMWWCATVVTAGMVPNKSLYSVSNKSISGSVLHGRLNCGRSPYFGTLHSSMILALGSSAMAAAHLLLLASFSESHTAFKCAHCGAH